MIKSIMQTEETCFICGTNKDLQVHHVFEGIGRRNISEREGLVVYLCASHHTGSCGVHGNNEYNLWLKKRAEWTWLCHTHKSVEEFIELFNKNYLDIEYGSRMDQTES